MTTTNTTAADLLSLARAAAADLDAGASKQVWQDAIAELGGSADVSAKRLESLAIAVEKGVSADVFAALTKPLRLARRDSIVLPAHRYEGLSRGRGWARQGRGETAVWGERVDGGYRVGPGRWTVGGHDGFTRKGADDWTVKHVQVGDETWTVAN